MYQVVISSPAKEILKNYAIVCNYDNGPECASRLLESYNKEISLLELSPAIGCSRLRYIPSKYRASNFWPHLWFIYQIDSPNNKVYIDYIIDDRQNYGTFFKE